MDRKIKRIKNENDIRFDNTSDSLAFLRRLIL